ncbi:MAG TPA: hypothetical protein VHE79_09135 [Spirochaetia bacterium]
MTPWKTSWAETRARHLRWWDHEGLVLAAWGTGLPRAEAWDRVAEPPKAATLEDRHRDPAHVSARILHEMSGRDWPADMLPVAWPDLGTVSLAPTLGAVEGFAEDRIWYEPCIGDPASFPGIRFDPSEPRWRRLVAVVRETVQLARGRYLVGMPAIIPNLDVLAELRGTEALLFDMMDRPEWVEERLVEIDVAWEAAFTRMREIIARDGGMAFGYFMLWGTGNVGLLQCDVAATLSPRMFERFAVPALRRECAFLDHSMFHVDGHQCLDDVDMLLDIDGLDAIEWTPDPQIPSGGNPCWYPLYRKVLERGKSLWVANARSDEVVPLLDAIGGRGVYLTVDVGSVEEMERVARLVEPYRAPPETHTWNRRSRPVTG